MTHSPTSVLARVAAGDPRAVEACLDLYGPLVWSIARRYAGNHADAEDAVQEIFIDLWKSAARFEQQQASEATFVAMIARRRLIDRLRAQGRRRERLGQPVELSDDDHRVLPVAERDADARKATAAFETLKPEQRKVVEMHFLEGWSHNEIATQTGMPLGTVKTFVRRGLEQIREIVCKTPGKGGPR